MLDERTTEVLVPPRVLAGLIPDCLLDEYQFWRTGATTLRGYPKPHRGSGATDVDSTLLVQLQLQVYFRESSGGGVLSVDVQASDTGLVAKQRLASKLAFMRATRGTDV